MKNASIFLIAIGLSISVLVGCSDEEKKVNADIENAKIVENVKLVKTKKVASVDFKLEASLPGVTNPYEEVAVTAKVSGSIENKSVDVGDKVNKEDVLLKIDDETYNLQYQKALSGVENSKIRLSRLQNYGNKPGAKPPVISNAIAMYEASEINYNDRKDAFERASEKYEKIILSKEDYDQSKNQYELAKIDFNKASVNLDQTKRNWNYDVEGAKIALGIANNDLRMLKLNLDNTEVKSPISGIISSGRFSEGENISAGMEVFRVINIDKVYFESGVSEQEIGSIKNGMEVDVVIDSLGSNVYKGIITSISPTFDDKSKTYPFKALIDNPDNQLKAGMFATVKFILKERKGSKAIIKKSLFIEKDKSFVFVDQKSVAIKKEVKTGYENDEYVEIIEGLNGTELIVYEGIDNIKNGDKIKSN